MSAATYFYSSQMPTEEQQADLTQMSLGGFFSPLDQEKMAGAAHIRAAKQNEESLQPYQDLLFQRLRCDFSWRKDEILAAMMEKGEATLFTYNTVGFHLPYAEFQEQRKTWTQDKWQNYIRGQEELGRSNYESRLWSMTTEVTEEGVPIRYQKKPSIKMSRLIWKTDLLTRIALFFGPQFQVSVTYTVLKETEFYTANTCSVVLQMPLYPKRGQMAKALATYKKYKTHTEHVPCETEELCSNGTWLDAIADVPPPPAAPTLQRAERHICHCDYCHDDEEEDY